MACAGPLKAEDLPDWSTSATAIVLPEVQSELWWWRLEIFGVRFLRVVDGEDISGLYLRRRVQSEDPFERGKTRKCSTTGNSLECEQLTIPKGLISAVSAPPPYGGGQSITFSAQVYAATTKDGGGQISPYREEAANHEVTANARRAWGPSACRVEGWRVGGGA